MKNNSKIQRRIRIRNVWTNTKEDAESNNNTRYVRRCWLWWCFIIELIFWLESMLAFLIFRSIFFCVYLFLPLLFNSLTPKATNSQIWFINSMNKNAASKMKIVTLDACTIQSMFTFMVQPENQPNKCITSVNLYSTNTVYCTVLLLYVDHIVSVWFILNETMQTMPLTIAYTLWCFEHFQWNRHEKHTQKEKEK